MADQQLALTRTQRMPTQSSHISKPARPLVPAFLLKLFEMVSNSENSNLIQWSEAGDSFFVMDHERFAHEVLGRWFKHRNFSSFVRQLNMYGFHKIPHLQQGVLKSDSDTEFWNFAHPNFQRNKPGLLSLIQRKKQSQQGGDDASLELRDASVVIGSVPANPNALPPAAPTGQVLDMQSVLAGINSIKRHQTTISNELNDLKRTNVLLWQAAEETRQKHQKQQDTINRIVKFLAGVFGNHPGSAGSGGVSPGVSVNQHGDDGNVAPVRRNRLMIEDTKRDGPRKSVIEELTEVEQPQFDYDSIATPVSIPSPVPSEPVIDDKAPTAEEEKQLTPRSLTPTSPGKPTLDFNAFINTLSPAQLTSFVAHLASQTLPDPNATGTLPTAPANTSPPATGGSLTTYNSNLNNFNIDHANYNPSILDNLISFDGYDPPAPQGGEIPGGGQLMTTFSDPDVELQRKATQKQYTATNEIEKDVNAVNTSLFSLMQTMGIDPSMLPDDPSTVTAADSAAAALSNSSTLLPTPSTATTTPLFNPSTTPSSSSSSAQIPAISTSLPHPSSFPSLSADADSSVNPLEHFDFSTFLRDFPDSAAAGVGGFGMGLGGQNVASMGAMNMGGLNIDTTGINMNDIVDMDYSMGGAEGEEEPSTAFLDEVDVARTPTIAVANSLANGAPPTPENVQGSPVTGTGRGVGGMAGRKRKSDVVLEFGDILSGADDNSPVTTASTANVATAKTASIAQSRTKRRKDK